MPGRWRTLAAGAALLACCAVVGCTVPGDGGTRTMFSAAGADMSGQGASPGQLGIYAAQLAASGHPSRIVLRSVSLLPLPGFRLPRLVRAGLLTASDPDYATTSATWPPPAASGHGRVLVLPVAGAAVWPGGKGVQIIYALSGSSRGAYATAGIAVTYSLAGDTQTARLYQGAFLWYTPGGLTAFQRHEDGKRYQAASDHAWAVLRNLPGAG
jgi:hypothetical protein